MNVYLKEKELLPYEVWNLLIMKTEEDVIENNHKITVTFDFESGKTVALTTGEIRIK